MKLILVNLQTSNEFCNKEGTHEKFFNLPLPNLAPFYIYLHHCRTIEIVWRGPQRRDGNERFRRSVDVDGVVGNARVNGAKRLDVVGRPPFCCDSQNVRRPYLYTGD